MAKVELSGAADADLDEILTYSSIQFGDAVASDYFFSFEEAFALLERHPQVGAPAEEVGAGIRCLSHRSHRIFYEIMGSTVRVLRVLHHALDVDGRLSA